MTKPDLIQQFSKQHDAGDMTMRDMVVKKFAPNELPDYCAVCDHHFCICPGSKYAAEQKKY